jgi:hypothetical protein
MKRIYNKWISLSELRGQIPGQTPLVSLGNSIELPALISRVGHRIVSAVFPRKVKFSSRLSSLVLFGRLLIRIHKNHGSMYVVKWLKSSQLAIQKLIAGSAVESLRALEPDLPLRRLVNGLPSVIPSYDRKAIRNGSFSVIRWWLTIFSFYRVLEAPGKLKLSTITDGFSGTGRCSDFQFPLAYLVRSRVLDKFRVPSLSTDPKLLFLETSSPSSKVS